MIVALLTALAAPAPAEPPRPTVVLRVSRAFVEGLAGRGFDKVVPVETTKNGAAVHGTARATGGYTVTFHSSTTEAAFDLRVSGCVETRLAVTRGSVCVRLDGTSPLAATRRVAFDGDGYAGGPVGVAADYGSAVTAVDTARRGPLAPLVRRVAGRVAGRALPGADADMTDTIRAGLRAAVTDETDRVIGVLNAVREAREELGKVLRDRGLGGDAGRPVVATTDDAMVLGFGFPAGASPELPVAAGPVAPVELWVHQPLTLFQRLVLVASEQRLREVWDGRLKPQFVEQLEERSPELAGRLKAAAGGVRIDLDAAPGWHRVRFFAERTDEP